MEVPGNEDDIRTVKHVRMIIALEKTRRIFRRIHRTVGKGRQQGVSMVLAKNNKGEWIEQHDPSNIFCALIKEYKAKYHQTERTPPMTTPLVQYLGYLGMGRHSDNVLAGKVGNVPGLQPYSKILLEKLRNIQGFEPIPVGISARDYQSGWKKARENKSSGGDLIHFGNCKAFA